MTILGSLLDSFDSRTDAAASPASGPEDARRATEAETLAAYEEGYRSGWDDCTAAEQEAFRKVSAELARNLGDLGFTYHEARSQLLSDLEGLLEAFFGTVLPKLQGTAIASRVVEDVLDLASEGLDAPVEIIVPPSEVGTLRALLPQAPTFPVRVVEEPALAVGQAYVGFGAFERKYDLTEMSERLLDALQSAAVSDARIEERDADG